MHVALSGNSSGDVLPAPGDYRTGCPEGKGSCQRCRGYRTNIRGCIRVSGTIPDNYRVRNKFIRQVFTGIGKLSTDSPEGGMSMIGVLGGGGVDIQIAYPY